MVQVVTHPLVQSELTLLRRSDTSPKSFRESLRRISIFLLYEFLRNAETSEVEIETPLERTGGHVLNGMTFVSILRAGIPVLDVALDMVPHSISGFVGIKRDENTLSPIVYYVNLPPNMGDTVILDPMVATAGTVMKTMELVKERGGVPKGVISVICSRYAVRILTEKFPSLDIITAAIDERLNDKGYIVPGLGDCGDRYYGNIKNQILKNGGSI